MAGAPLRVAAAGGSRRRQAAGPALVHALTHLHHHHHHRRTFNQRITTKPTGIFYAHSTEEAAAAAACAFKAGVKLSPAGGRQGFQGRAVPDNFLVVDVTNITDTSMSPDNKVFTAGAGNSNIMLLGALSRYNLTGAVIPTGYCSFVGIPGWNLGGGFGLLGRYLGLGERERVLVVVWAGGGEGGGGGRGGGGGALTRPRSPRAHRVRQCGGAGRGAGQRHSRHGQLHLPPRPLLGLVRRRRRHVWHHDLLPLQGLGAAQRGPPHPALCESDGTRRAGADENTGSPLPTAMRLAPPPTHL